MVRRGAGGISARRTGSNLVTAREGRAFGVDTVRHCGLNGAT